MGALKLTYQPCKEDSFLRIAYRKGIKIPRSKAAEEAQNPRLDYSPFGSIMPGRNYQSNSYRFGYNAGSEKDDEITGVTGSHITTFYREYDTRLGRTWSLDPVFQPWQSSYSSMDNNPIWFNDPMGDVTDGWENSNGDIIYNDKTGETGDSYTDDNGIKWNWIGQDIDESWGDDKKIDFLTAQNDYMKDLIRENVKTLKHLTTINDVLSDIVPITAILKGIYSLTTGTNPIEDFADLTLEGGDKYNSKEDKIDKNLTKAGLAAEYANMCVEMGSKDPLLENISKTKVAKGIPYVGPIITGVGITKTIIDAYFIEDEKTVPPKN